MTAPRRSFLTIRAIDPYGNGNLTAERYSTAVPDVSFFSARRLPACAFFKNCIHVFYPTRQSPDPRLRPCRLHGRHLCRSEEHTSELQSPCNLVCRLLLEKKKTKRITLIYIY